MLQEQTPQMQKAGLSCKADFNSDRIELASCLILKGQLVVKQALRANAPSDRRLIYEQGQGAASSPTPT
ncbi:hypothetical protein N9499_10125, partial [Octadecabacter sp.]|nr:hypothetical protein [Octadecabacter sp.]